MKKLMLVLITLGLFGTAYAGSVVPAEGKSILSGNNSMVTQQETGSIIVAELLMDLAPEYLVNSKIKVSGESKIGSQPEVGSSTDVNLFNGVIYGEYTGPEYDTH